MLAEREPESDPGDADRERAADREPVGQRRAVHQPGGIADRIGISGGGLRLRPE